MNRDELPLHDVRPSVDEVCGTAMKQQIAGRLDAAEALYADVLRTEPRHAVANHCLGMLKVQQRQPADGLPHLLAALEVRPDNPAYWLGYLEALLATRSWEQAKATLALARQHGLAGEAVDDYAKRLYASLPSVAAPPPRASRAERRREEAEAVRREDTLLGFIKQQRFEEAGTLAATMTEKYPERGLGWKILGALQWADKRVDDALFSMQNAVRLLQQDAEAHCNLATTLTKSNRLAEAEPLLRRAIELEPNSAAAHVHLSDAYQIQGRYGDAARHIRRAIALSGDRAEADSEMIYSTLLFILSHDPAVDADALFAEHKRVGDHFEAAWRNSWRRHPNAADRERVLEVGIVSGDLYDHAVASFIEPVLARLKSSPGIRLHAYYNNEIEDAVTRRMRGYFARWNSIRRVPNSEVVSTIRADRIDILIDLAGHTALNRLRVFAQRPAPVQISWIGYPGTTGMRSMDYFLADAYFLPPGRFDRLFTEKLVHLPAQTPFQPHAGAPPVNALPALAAGHLTFGTFNRLGKINDATIALWSDLLTRLPEARMLIAGIPSAEQNQSLTERLGSHGVAPDRLAFHARCDMNTYLALYNRVDICLDTTPYNGGTTTIHALWMGVPTLSVAGATPAARSGAAILGQMGLHEFVAGSPAEFVAKGLYWADHRNELAALRAELRERWARAPERGAEVIVRALETALRRMWHRWCDGLPAEPFQIAAPD